MTSARPVQYHAPLNPRTVGYARDAKRGSGNYTP